MQEAGLFNNTVTTLNSSDPGAATSLKDKSNRSSTSPNSIKLRHELLSETTTTRLSYRDANSRRHEMKVIDKPIDDNTSASLASSLTSDSKKSKVSRGDTTRGGPKHSPRD